MAGLHILPLGLGLLIVLACIPRSGVDMILTGGTILTMDKYLPPSEALAIVDGRILAVGREEEILPLANRRTKRIDLQGAVVVPGLMDSHLHLIGFGQSLDQLQLVGTSSAEEIAGLVAARAAELPPGTWIQAQGWDQNDWDTQAFPTRQVLDQVAPDHPVILSRVDGHAIWTNSRALTLAGITAGTPNPQGGVILKDESGDPTGVLIDNAASLVRSVVPPPTRDDTRAWLLAAVQQLNQVGLTEIHDPGVDGATLEVIRELVDEGNFNLRYYGMLDGSDEELLERHLSKGPVINYGGRLTVRTVKFYLDGALGSRGAALLSPYSDDPRNRGLIRTSPDVLEALVIQTLRFGFQPAIHAIGDRANRLALDIYERVTPQFEGQDFRPRIEHAQVIAARDIRRFARLGVIAAMQPSHATSDMYWAEDRLGPRRVRSAYIWQRLLDAGVTIAGGSDSPVESANPLLQLYAARTRQDTTGWPEDGWYPDQKMGGLDALRTLTTWSAYAAIEESSRGKVFPGYDADLTVLSKNPVIGDPQELLSTDVLMTVLAGQIVWFNRPGWQALADRNDARNDPDPSSIPE